LTRGGGLCPRACGSNATRSAACQGLNTLVTSGTALTLTSGTWYEGKVVVDNDPNDANLLQLGWGGHRARQRVGTD
jgi:hypothetical protein